MSAPYLTICILCVLSGIAFLYRFCLVFQSSREGYETGASKTIGSREIQMDYYTIEENEKKRLTNRKNRCMEWEKKRAAG